MVGVCSEYQRTAGVPKQVYSGCAGIRVDREAVKSNDATLLVGLRGGGDSSRDCRGVHACVSAVVVGMWLCTPRLGQR